MPMESAGAPSQGTEATPAQGAPSTDGDNTAGTAMEGKPASGDSAQPASGSAPTGEPQAESSDSAHAPDAPAGDATQPAPVP